MPPRKPPAHAEIIAAIKAVNRNEEEFARGHAVRWDPTEAALKRTLRTTYGKAAEWMRAALGAEGAELVALYQGWRVLRSSDPSGGVWLHEWSGATSDMNLMPSVRFDAAGRRIPEGRPGGERRPEGPGDLWILRANALRQFAHDQVREARAQEESQRRELSRLREWFQGHYGGDGFEVLTRALRPVLDAAPDELMRDWDDAVLLDDADGTAKRFFGGPESLTIRLRGAQVGALVELLRKL